MRPLRIALVAYLIAIGTETARADQTITFTATTTNKYVTHLLLGANGRLTAWQDCDAAAWNCPRKSYGSYHREGDCIVRHIDWNMSTYNYPTNGRSKLDGSPC